MRRNVDPDKMTKRPIGHNQSLTVAEHTFFNVLSVPSIVFPLLVQLTPFRPSDQPLCHIEGTFFFLAVIIGGDRLRQFLRGGERNGRTRGMIASRSVCMAKYPRGSYILYPLLPLGGGHTGKRIIN